ncbi:MAG: PASTA domain-containing protein [Spirochaetales bacterium]|nr:PASTA domain-containing protein [Spirochaetales bacterium]
MGPLGKKLQKWFFGESEDSDKRFYRTFILFAIATVLIMIIVVLATFFLSLKGVEDTMVPDVKGLELADAMVKLEEKALYSSVQLRFTQNIEDKGHVVEQEPEAGNSVRAGSRVVLKVSKGSAIEKLDDYVGWRIEDLESHVKSMSSIYGPLLSIKKPVQKIYDSSPAGTILVQSPEAGIDITAATEIELVVSKGPQGQNRIVYDYTGMSFGEVLESVAKSNLSFVFTTDDGGRKHASGTVLSQSPTSGAEVPIDTVMQFVIADYDKTPEGYVFGILERTLPDYQVPVTLNVEAITPDGDKKQILEMKTNGGILTIPYLEEEGTLIKIIVADSEIVNYSVKADLE